MSSRDVCWAATGFWGTQPPFFAIHSFMFKYTFWVDLLTSFRQSFMRWSGLLHSKQFLFFFWYNSTTLVKQMIYLMDWSISPILPNTSTSLSADSSVSPSHFSSLPGSSSASSFLMIKAQTAKMLLPFSLHRGINSLVSEYASCLIH